MRRLALSVVVVLWGAGQCRGDIAGYLVAWGRDDRGQIAVPPREDYVAIAAGGNHTLAITEDGTLTAWGINNDNQCNVPDTSGFESIAAGQVHSLARRNDGTLAAWGNNTYGQGTLGPAGNDFTEIDAGPFYSLAFREDGTIEAWGMNNKGQLDVPDGNDFLAVTGGMSTVWPSGRTGHWSRGGVTTSSSLRFQPGTTSSQSMLGSTTRLHSGETGH